MESYPSGKGQVCKTSMQRFDSARLLKRLVFAGRFFSECFEKFLLFKIAFRLNILSHLLVALFCMRFAWFSHFTKLAFCKTFFSFPPNPNFRPHFPSHKTNPRLFRDFRFSKI